MNKYARMHQNGPRKDRPESCCVFMVQNLMTQDGNGGSAGWAVASRHVFVRSDSDSNNSSSGS